MSGGHLVVLDRAGREVKQFHLPSGSATLGRNASCDIRIMLPSVQPHHASIFVHANQAVIQNADSGETLLNGVSVSVAALRQGDVVAIGGRQMRWRYAHPAPHHARTRPQSPALQGVGRRTPRGKRGRKSEGPNVLAPHSSHRHSAPAAAISTRQVAIVQPQRRDTAGHYESVSSPAISVVANVRRRGTAKSDSEMDTPLNKSIEEINKSRSPKSSPINLQNTTKATLWIESRKSSPRKSLQEIPSRVAITPKKTFSAKKSTPLRMAVLKKAQSAQKMRVTKIQAPLTIDHTKQAAIMLMTGHTPKQATPGKRASLVITKRPRGRPKHSRSASTGLLRVSSGSDSTMRSTKASLEQSPSVMEITDSDTGQSSIRDSDVSQLSERLSRGSMRSPTASPIKSALKDPRKSTRKTESIKFDLSNLDKQQSPDDRNSVRLRYSESPSPRPVQSRARDILRRTLGSDENINTSNSSSPNPIPSQSPSSPRFARGSLMLREALRSASPDQVETYSIVDLVSADSNSSLYGSASDTSRYNSLSNSGRATRARSLVAVASSTPAVARMSRSRSAVASMSYDSIRDDSQMTYFSEVSTRSKSLSTPVNTPKNVTYNVSAKKKSQSPVNTEKVDYERLNIKPRRSRHSLGTPDRSKENGTYSKSLSPGENTTATLDASAKSKRNRSTLTGENIFENITLNSTRSRSPNRSQTSEANMTSTRSTFESPKHDGTSTPKNHQSPEEAGTPVLSIQSLLYSTQNATLPQQSRNKSTNKVLKRKTIGGRLSVPRKRGSVTSKSLRLSTRASLRSDKASNISPSVSDTTEEMSQDDGDTTPKSAVKLVQEAVKNKHSTAKKPKSKRSIIDNLNESDIVKQLFNSPVKRKLSQSMIEFSRKQHLDEDSVPVQRPTRKTIAVSGRTPDNSVLEESQNITPEIFVSPLSTPNNSPNIVGIKRLFVKNTPENDLRNVRGVKKLLQTPRLRRSVRNDLTQVSGVKSVFARSPKNCLSDVRIKDVFAASPNNDLRRVSGVKTLFQTEKKNKSPKNDLRDVPNVRDLYKVNSPPNDLRNVSGVKRVMRRNSPRNDLGDVRGVRSLFHLEKQREDLNNISGIEELFSESHQTSNVTAANSESSFNLLIGKLAVRSYAKAKSFSLKTIQKPKNRRAKSLQTSFSSISNNVEDWLENELRKRMHNGDEKASSTKKSLDKPNEENMSYSISKSNRSSAVISRSMSRSKNILELSMSGRKGRKSANNCTNIIVEGDKSKVNASNKYKTNIEPPRNDLFRSRNRTTNNNSDIIGDEQISTRNISQFDGSNYSLNISKTNRETSRKSISRSTINNSNIVVGECRTSKGNKTQFDVSNNSVPTSKSNSDRSRKNISRHKNQSAINSSDIIVDDNQVSKGSGTQYDSFNNSVMKTKKCNEITPKKSMNKSKNKTAGNKSDIVEGNETSNTLTKQQNTPNVETPRKSIAKSKNKTNRSRELLKLATDTVEGNTLLPTTRIRNSTLTRTASEGEERKKSTSEIYSAHTLPIKKRSLVDRDTSANRSDKSVLPIKKRAVVHSTPVKGRLSFTINASDIGRVSPIAPLVEETVDAEADPTPRNTEETTISHKTKLLQARSSKIGLEAEGNIERISPAPVRRLTKQSLDMNNVKKRKSSVVITKKTPGISPLTSATENVETRKLRGRNVTRDQNLLQVDTGKEVPVPNKGRKRNTLEVQYQQVVNESARTKRGRRGIAKQPSEKGVSKRRLTRTQKVASEKVLTPKKLTRTKASKVGVVISKPSLQMKPTAKKQTTPTDIVNGTEQHPIKKLSRTGNAQSRTSKQPENNRKNTKSKASSNEAKKTEIQESAGTRNTRNTRKKQLIPENNVKESEANIKPKRGRKANAQSNKVDANKPETQKIPTRSVGRQNTNVNIRTNFKKIEMSKKDSSKSADSGSSENASRGRKRKIAIEESPSKVKKSKTDNETSEKNQRIENEPIKSKQSTRGRQKKNFESSENIETVKESRTRRGGRVNETETTEVSNKKVTAKKKESNAINNEAAELRNVHGRKKELENIEITNKQNKAEAKRPTRRGEGDVAEKTTDAKVTSSRRQKVNDPENPEVKSVNRQKASQPEKSAVKTRIRQKDIEPVTAVKTIGRQKAIASEKTIEKTTGRQKVIEAEKAEVRTTRRQKEAEPEKQLAGRKRKIGADCATAEEASQPPKARKTSAVRSADVQEPQKAQKPAARTRRR